MWTLAKALNPIIIPAPFGNYLHFRSITSTLGTHTRERRAGPLKRLWRLASTLRFYPAIGACVNRMQLPSPGIDVIWHRYVNNEGYAIRLRQCILSVTARNNYDWGYLFEKCHDMRPLAIELNLSCPNIHDADRSDYQYVLKDAMATGLNVIAKLPPIGYMSRLDYCMIAGIRNFHCCNTLATPAGGMSGKPLKQLSLEACREVNKTKPEVLIGGGGITSAADVIDYHGAGATHYSVGSAWFNPFRWPTLTRLTQHLPVQVT